MADDPLRTYLNDHLAGSVAAISLVEDLVDKTEGTPLGATLRGVLADIREDQAVLQELLDRVGGESTTKKAMGWLAEKLGAVKLHADVAGEPRLARLEALEALALGILGKRSLWAALETLAPDPRLHGLDLAELRRRAEAQHATVERARLAAASEALRPDAG